MQQGQPSKALTLRPPAWNSKHLTTWASPPDYDAYTIIYIFVNYTSSWTHGPNNSRQPTTITQKPYLWSFCVSSVPLLSGSDITTRKNNSQINIHVCFIQINYWWQFAIKTKAGCIVLHIKQNSTLQHHKNYFFLLVKNGSQSDFQSRCVPLPRFQI